MNCSNVYGESFSFVHFDLKRLLNGAEFEKCYDQTLLAISERNPDFYPNWLTSKSHHFAYLKEDSSYIYALIDGGVYMYIVEHGWTNR